MSTLQDVKAESVATALLMDIVYGEMCWSARYIATAVVKDEGDAGSTHEVFYLGVRVGYFRLFYTFHAGALRPCAAIGRGPIEELDSNPL